MKNDQQISSPNQGRRKPFRGQGDNCPHIPKKNIGGSAGISNPLPTTIGIYHEEKQKKNKNHDYQNKNKKMLDAMY